MSKEVLLPSLEKGFRPDGRALDQFRQIKIELDVSKSAEGSARVRFGETEVIAGVKLAVELPYADFPDQGKLSVNAELLPISNPEFEFGPPSLWAIELARVVDRGIRESKAIDFNTLCLNKGKEVWSIAIDICTINDSGNILDASALAALAALQCAYFPKYENGIINYLERTNKRLELNHFPIQVTVYKIGNYFLIDPTHEEEKVIDARLSFTFMENGKICAIQKGGDEALAFEEVMQMLDLAKAKSEELRKILKAATVIPETHKHQKIVPYDGES